MKTVRLFKRAYNNEDFPYTTFSANGDIKEGEYIPIEEVEKMKEVLEKLVMAADDYWTNSETIGESNDSEFCEAWQEAFQYLNQKK